MTDFKAGGVPTPDYDTEDINYVSQKTEFTEDVFVYGKLYADLGGDVQTFSTAGVERVRITKDGKFGIDTADPQVHLDVGGASSNGIAGVTNPMLYAGFKQTGSFADTNLFGGVILGAGLNGNSPTISASKNNSGTALPLLFQTNATERVRIDKDGQVMFIPMTETERDALTAQAGGVIYNSTTNKLQCYNGTTWNNLF